MREKNIWETITSNSSALFSTASTTAEIVAHYLEGVTFSWLASDISVLDRDWGLPEIECGGKEKIVQNSGISVVYALWDDMNNFQYNNND